MIVNIDRNSFFDRIAQTSNKGFAIAEVSYFADTSVKGGSSALRIKFMPKLFFHRKPTETFAATLGEISNFELTA